MTLTEMQSKDPALFKHLEEKAKALGYIGQNQSLVIKDNDNDRRFRIWQAAAVMNFQTYK